MNFEHELTELLDARAARVDVEPVAALLDRPVLLEASEGGSASVTSIAEPRSPSSERGSDRRGSASWLLGAAAALVVVLGVFGLTRGAGETSLDLDAVGVTDGERRLDEADFIVWFEPEASQVEIDAVGVVLAESELIEAARYVTRAEAFAEFEEYWEDTPEILDAVEPEQLPTSFRVSAIPETDFGEMNALMRELGELDGVRDLAFGHQLDGTEADLAVSASPVFVLPPEGFSVSPVEGSGPPVGDVPSLETMIVGRRTATGFTDMVVIDRGVDRGFLATVPLGIGGRIVEPSIDQDGLVAEQLGDGTWLRFTSWRDPDFLDIVVPSTSLADDRLVFEGSDGFEVLTTSAPGPSARTNTVVFGPDGPELMISTAAVSAGAPPLFYAAANDGDAEPFSNGAIDGYFLRPSNSTSLGDFNSFSWRISDDHVANVLMPGSDDKVIETVMSLRVVDQATWQAAIDAGAQTN